MSDYYLTDMRWGPTPPPWADEHYRAPVVIHYTKPPTKEEIAGLDTSKPSFPTVLPGDKAGMVRVAASGQSNYVI